jgi:hypothetical protein
VRTAYPPRRSLGRREEGRQRSPQEGPVGARLGTLCKKDTLCARFYHFRILNVPAILGVLMDVRVLGAEVAAARTRYRVGSNLETVSGLEMAERPWMSRCLSTRATRTRTQPFDVGLGGSTAIVLPHVGRRQAHLLGGARGLWARGLGAGRTGWDSGEDHLPPPHFQAPTPHNVPPSCALSSKHFHVLMWPSSSPQAQSMRPGGRGHRRRPRWGRRGRRRVCPERTFEVR